MGALPTQLFVLQVGGEEEMMVDLELFLQLDGHYHVFCRPVGYIKASM